MRSRSILATLAPISYLGALRVVSAAQSRPVNSYLYAHAITSLGTYLQVWREENLEGRGGPRIAFVGGRSYQWGPKIIQYVALNEALRGDSLSLQDIDGEALDDMYVARVMEGSGATSPSRPGARERRSPTS
jgi:hypothetical protein